MLLVAKTSSDGYMYVYIVISIIQFTYIYVLDFLILFMKVIISLFLRFRETNTFVIYQKNTYTFVQYLFDYSILLLKISRYI